MGPLATYHRSSVKVVHLCDVRLDPSTGINEIYAVSQFRVCILRRTRLLWPLKATWRQLLLNGSISWLRHQMFLLLPLCQDFCHPGPEKWQSTPCDVATFSHSYFLQMQTPKGAAPELRHSNRLYPNSGSVFFDGSIQRPIKSQRHVKGCPISPHKPCFWRMHHYDPPRPPISQDSLCTQKRRKKERKKMATSCGVDRHFRGSEQQKS